MADDDLTKPWYRSWTKWGVVSSVMLAVPTIFAGTAWTINAFVNHGIALAGKVEVDATLKSHGELIDQIKSGMNSLDTQMQLIGQQQSELLEGQKKQGDQTDKILWYLIDARKAGSQSNVGSDNAAFEAQAKP